MHFNVGDRLWLRGPFGSRLPTPADQTAPRPCRWWLWRCPVALAGAKHLASCRSKSLPLVGARTADDLLYVDRFEQLAAPAQTSQVIATTEDGSAGM